MSAISGKKLIYLYRVLENAGTASGTRIAYVTENGKDTSMDSDSTATKDGSIRATATPEIEISSTSILKKDDTMIDTLYNAMLDGKVIEVWEANLDAPVEGSTDKFSGTYYQGYLTECNFSSNAEDNVEVEMTIGVNGKGASGEVTVSEDQQEDAGYAFADTTPTEGA